MLSFSFDGILDAFHLIKNVKELEFDFFYPFNKNITLLITIAM
jgi:hypothetical protein